MAAAAHASTHALVGQFSKHMLGSALATKGLVAYEHDLSSTWTSLVNAHSAAIMAGVNAALSVF